MESYDDDAGENTVIELALGHSSSGRRSVGIQTNNGRDAKPSAENEGYCDIEPTSNDRGCFINFEWENDRWYTLQLQEVSVTANAGAATWQASIVDNETNESTLVGTIDIVTTTSWSHAEFLLGHANRVPHNQCVNGLPLSSVLFTGGQVNATEPLDWQDAEVFSDCMLLGAGHSGSARRINDELLYSLQLGQ